jgi:flagella basal body P-ring formation protein FlgA
MNASLQRLASLFFATILIGVVATMLAPVVAGSMAHAQEVASPAPHGTARITVARATRALMRGDTLGVNDFVLQDTVIAWHWNSIAPDTAKPLVGWVIRRQIAAGEVLRAPAVAPAPVINVGAMVKVLWQDGPVHLVLNGVATNSAALGANVGVRVDRNRRFDGVAVAPNLVRLR